MTEADRYHQHKDDQDAEAMYAEHERQQRESFETWKTKYGVSSLTYEQFLSDCVNAGVRPDFILQPPVTIDGNDLPF